MRNVVALVFGLLVSFGFAFESVRGADSQELNRIKGLVGTWTGEVDHGNGPEKVTLVYRVTAGGSAVVETYNPGSSMEMVTVYHDRDGKLELTHYCMLGNQPRLKLTGSSDKSVSLELAKDSDIEKDEMHMCALTIEFESEDKIKQIWSMNMDGKRTKGPAVELTRKP
ncbi:MAG: hypothetical protein HKN47_08785 [Pirellulaceae bacterium]|nr:hypothetical protein [Pirellulaceae bacterium]